MTSFPSLAFNSKDPIDISADLIDYVDADESLTASGNVIVTQGTSTLKADSLRYERQTRKIFARGHVFLKDKESVLLGDMVEYDLINQSGSVTSALGYESPWLFSGATWEKELDYFVGRGVSFTSCELVDSHYHFRASSVHLVPDQHFWAWNNVVYLDKTPVLYSPFIYKSLLPRRVVVRFQPGHDEVNGNFLKTMATVRINDNVYNKILYDHYSETGNGFGNELNYKHSDRLKGSLFGYYIDPHGNPELQGSLATEQYNIRSYHWQQLDPIHTLQSSVNIRKNISFNNQYFPQDNNQSVNDLASSVALTRQKRHINQRLVVEANNAPDPGDDSPFAATHMQTGSVPRYDFTLYQIPLWSPAVSSTTVFRPGPRLGPLMFNSNATFGNTYYRLDKQNHANGDGSFTLSNAMVLSRNWSFTPTLTPQLHWQDKFNPQPPPPAGSTAAVSNVGLFRGYQGRVGTAETLRWRTTSSLTLDQTYSLVARMEPNGMGLDRSPSDGGIETHHLNWLAFWRPSRKTLLRSYSGFDMRNIADESEDTYNQRKFDPWTTEMTYQATRRSEYFGRYSLGFYPFRDQLWEGSFRYRGPFRTILNTGLLYNRGQPGTMTWNNTIGIFLSPGWRVDAVLHALVPSTTFNAALHKGTLIDEEIIVTRDMHCWEIKFIYRNIPPVSKSYSVLFNLKLGVAAEKRITDEDLESQFYPWRAGEYAN